MWRKLICSGSQNSRACRGGNQVSPPGTVSTSLERGYIFSFDIVSFSDFYVHEYSFLFERLWTLTCVLKHSQWQEANKISRITASDYIFFNCVFFSIYRWYHHTRSEEHRTLALSYRFLRPPYFNVSGCPRVQSIEKIRNLTTVTLLTDLETRRWEFVENLWRK